MLKGRFELEDSKRSLKLKKQFKLNLDFNFKKAGVDQIINSNKKKHTLI